MSSLDVKKNNTSYLANGREILNETTSSEKIDTAQTLSGNDLGIEGYSDENSGSSALLREEENSVSSFTEQTCIDKLQDDYMERHSNSPTSNCGVLASVSPVKRPRHKPGERKGLLLMAVKDVLEQNISMRKAAQRYNLAKSSLCDFVRKNNIKLPNNRYKTVNLSSLSTSIKKETNSQAVLLQNVENIREYISALKSQAKNNEIKIDDTNQVNGCFPHKLRFDSFKIPFKVSARSVSNLNQQNWLSSDRESEKECTSVQNSEYSIADTTSFAETVSPIYKSIESPWQNVSGLPTQVPIRNWGLWPLDNHRSKLSLTSSVENSTTQNSSHCFVSTPSCATRTAIFEDQLHASELETKSRSCVADSYQCSVSPLLESRNATSELLSRIKLSNAFVPNTEMQSKFNLLSNFLSKADSHIQPSPSHFSHLSTDMMLSLIKSQHSFNLQQGNAPNLNLFAQCESTLRSLNTDAGSNETPQTYVSNQADRVSSVDLKKYSSSESTFAKSQSSTESYFSPSQNQLKSKSIDNNLPHQSPSEKYSSDLEYSLVSSNHGTCPKIFENRFPPEINMTENVANTDTQKLSEIAKKLCDFQILSGRQFQPEDLLTKEAIIHQLQQNIMKSLLDTDNPNLGNIDEAYKITCELPLPTNTSKHKTAINPQSNYIDHAEGLINFINKSPSPFHVVRSICDILDEHGFHRLNEEENWRIHSNECFYITRNSSSIFAVTVGGKSVPTRGFSILCAHSDSPGFRLKSNSKISNQGFIQLDVESYGRSHWHTWFDRDLALAGRCVIRLPNGAIAQRLINIERPIACAPSVINVIRNSNILMSSNEESLFVPIICTSLSEQILHTGEGSNIYFPTANHLTPDSQKAETSSVNTHTSEQSNLRGHPDSLIKLISNMLSCENSDIVELELHMNDSQPASLGGVLSEFIHAPRLEAQFNAYASIQGLIQALPSLQNDNFIRIVCIFDNAVMGSQSAQGANSSFTSTILRRIVDALDSSSKCDNTNRSDSAFEQTMSRSFLLSTNQTNAYNRGDNCDVANVNEPEFNNGLVLQYGCSRNCSTNSISAAITKEIAYMENIPIREKFMNKFENGEASLGTILSSQLGVPVAEIGGAQLAIHSCRETTSIKSITQAVSMYSGYFHHLSDVMRKMSFN